jgi:hypothetical protein
MAALTQRAILRLWLPLEVAWLFMAVEGPFLAAVIARLADPELQLAAFGVALGFAFLFESPIILILSAATALVENRDSLRKLRCFTYALNAGITLLLALFLLPPVFRAVTGTFMGLPREVIRLALPACALFLPWPAAIGYRRFYQGILVRHGLTRRVAFGTALRLGTMSGTALLLAGLTPLPGALVGAAALSSGVVAEAAASRFWARAAVRALLAAEATPEYLERPLTYRGIARFYLPLALTSILAMGVNPLVAFFLGRSRMPLESLAVMPVVNGLLFLFHTPGLTFQEVAISLYGDNRDGFRALRRFAGWLTLATTCGLALLAFSPLRNVWLQGVAGLSWELARFARVPVALSTILPGITAVTCFQRALLVVARTTRPITWSTGIEVAGIAIALLVLTSYAGWTGAAAAVAAMATGRLASTAYLLPHSSRAVRAAQAQG